MIVRFLDTLSVASVDLIANDSGTGIAQLLAARFSERVRTMLLTNGDVEIDSPPAPLGPFIQMAKEERFADEVMTPSVLNKAKTRSADGIGGLTYTDPLTRQSGVPGSPPATLARECVRSRMRSCSAPRSTRS
jgi:haloalkane dehalogenase